MFNAVDAEMRVARTYTAQTAKVSPLSTKPTVAKLYEPVTPRLLPPAGEKAAGSCGNKTKVNLEMKIQLLFSGHKKLNK